MTTTTHDHPKTCGHVLIVEDHELLGQSLCIALRAEGLSVSTAQLSTPADLLAQVQTEPPDVVLLDLRLGPQMGDGVQLVRPLTDSGSRVLVVTGTTNRAVIAGAIEQGAAGFLPKSAPLELLADTVRRASRGECILFAPARQQLLNDLRHHRRVERERLAPLDRLTPREQLVLRELGEGKSVDVIASEQVVSTATVRTQVRGVLTKLGVSSQLAAVAMARRSGWLLATAGRRN